MKQFTLSDATEVLESGKHHVLHQVAHVALAERNGGAVTRRGSWRKPLGIVRRDSRTNYQKVTRRGKKNPGPQNAARDFFVQNQALIDNEKRLV
jgi:hypothetical protein